MKGIYKILSPSGAVYIGQSVNIENRFGQYKRLSCKYQHRLYRSFLKYGVDKHQFSVVHELPVDVSPIDMDKIEEYYIDVYRSSFGETMNLKSGGKHGSHSEETIKKLRGRKFSEDARKRMSLAKRNMSDETKRRMSENRKGKCIGNKSALGYKHSESALEKIREAGKNKSEYTRKLVSDNMKRIWVERKLLKYA